MGDIKQIFKLKVKIIFMWVISSCFQTFGWIGMPTPPLKIVGNKLLDPAGNEVVLHGWMQPNATWFNGRGKFYSEPGDWTISSQVEGMLSYLNEVADVMSDTNPRYERSHGWYATFSRLNVDIIGGWDHQRGLYDRKQFDGWISNFIVPYANYLKTRGVYLVISAVGPINTPDNGTKNAGVVEGQRLVTFWSIVAAHPGIKNADNIMFELMNEPVLIESSPGNGDWGCQQPKYHEAFRKWIQPVIDTIRKTGANNIIWVPTLDWQGSPYQWVDFPFKGENIGIAAHMYPAYAGCFDDAACRQRFWNQQYKVAADRWPLIITEMFWHPTPEDPMNLTNGTTKGFGNTMKNLIDAQGNVSYIVGFFAGDLVDDQYRPQNAPLTDKEGAQAYFSWQPEYKTLKISYGYRVIPGRIEFENFERMHGVRVESNPDNLAERHIGYINSRDWTKFLVDVKEKGTYSLKIRSATGADERNNIIIKNQTGTTIGTFNVDPSKSGSWHMWYIDSITVNLPQGKQELTFEFNGNSSYLFNLDWFELNFISSTTSVEILREFDPEEFVVHSVKKLFNNKIKILITSSKIQENDLSFKIYNINGEKIFESKFSKNYTKEIEINEIPRCGKGIYYMILFNKNKKVKVISLLKME